MNHPSVEERLQHLVEDFEAPATTTALRAIERRTQVLRRRRRVGVATGAGVVGVVVAVIAALALQHDDPPPDEPTVDIDPVQPPAGDGLPAFTLDLDGWEVTGASEELDVPAGFGGLPAVEVAKPGSVQVFRAPGTLTGPTVYLRHMPVSPTIGQTIFDTPVTIGDVSGLGWQMDDNVAMTWNPHGGQTTAWLQARNLGFEQVLEFANGLEPRDATISNPPASDDVFGFDPTVPMAGMVEDPIAPGGSPTVDRRIVTLSDGTTQVQITVDNTGESAFEGYLAGVLGGTWETVTVGDRPAALHTGSNPVPQGLPSVNSAAELNWLETTTAKVQVQITTDDRARIDTIIAGIRQISEEEWDELLANAPPTTTTTELGLG